MHTFGTDALDLSQEPHPRAVEMAERMREEAGAFGSCTFAGLIQAGFTTAEIIEHEPVARALASVAFVRVVDPRPDRVPDIVQKAVDAVSTRMPRMAGVEPEGDAEIWWGRYCVARSAWRLDPWPGQKERALDLLRRALGRIGPLLPRETNRIICAAATAMRVEVA